MVVWILCCVMNSKHQHVQHLPAMFHPLEDARDSKQVVELSLANLSSLSLGTSSWACVVTEISHISFGASPIKRWGLCSQPLNLGRL